ncbi:MAG: hypothetical protein GYB64_10950 [Chloroflexi bacterium]|nr:hypothetical protein [Chloroflexota bacterium]
MTMYTGLLTIHIAAGMLATGQHRIAYLLAPVGEFRLPPQVRAVRAPRR